MSGIEFGAVAPCRTCHGTGQSRNPEWGDKQAAKERQRVRRRGGDVDKPTEIVTCVECEGKGYLTVAEADAIRANRDRLQSSAAKSA